MSVALPVNTWPCSAPKCLHWAPTKLALVEHVAAKHGPQAAELVAQEVDVRWPLTQAVTPITMTKEVSMPCGICRDPGHRRETCPKKGAADAGEKTPASKAPAPKKQAAKKLCGYCKRSDGTHSSGCRRTGPAARRSSARGQKPGADGSLAVVVRALKTERDQVAARLAKLDEVLEQAQALLAG